MVTFRRSLFFVSVSALLASVACSSPQSSSVARIAPVRVTEAVQFDSDDPAIWVNRADPAKSLIIGTDKETGGGLYVFDLEGKIIREKTVSGLQRPNNVDLEYGLMLGGKPVDIAVTTERLTNKLRIFAVPTMAAVDGGGIEVFVGETLRDPMGISLYKRASDGAVFAIVGRKSGPSGSYLWQYRLEDDGAGAVKATLVRKFGAYSGKKEIESIAVDDAAGYVYYSDEMAGVRKYAADPDAAEAGRELAFFGQKDFARDVEGVSIYEVDAATGYILVSDQQRDTFNIYRREGDAAGAHVHTLVKTVSLSTLESDGSEVTSAALSSAFPGGLFVAMSTDKTFHFYSWEQIANAPGEQLKSRK
ncbi:3-phytase [Nibricoccus aquaticus]|uniref:3-phytase n=1 Tax=Nibricoccus aquaticus TaxID=2576891 RepID=A0A290QLL3_9BACT|nr:phytase [Nibricoccus aquaticus]ATC65351.1 3-phytase [Nibricoccus aquaticus]